MWWGVGCHHSACSAAMSKAVLTAHSSVLGAAIGPSCPWMSSAKLFLSLGQRALYSVWENKAVQPFFPIIPAAMLSGDLSKCWLQSQCCEHGAGQPCKRCFLSLSDDFCHLCRYRVSLPRLLVLSQQRLPCTCSLWCMGIYSPRAGKFK